MTVLIVYSKMKDGILAKKRWQPFRAQKNAKQYYYTPESGDASEIVQMHFYSSYPMA